jgi:hypothetical protein
LGRFVSGVGLAWTELQDANSSIQVDVNRINNTLRVIKTSILMLELVNASSQQLPDVLLCNIHIIDGNERSKFLTFPLWLSLVNQYHIDITVLPGEQVVFAHHSPHVAELFPRIHMPDPAWQPAISSTWISPTCPTQFLTLNCPHKVKVCNAIFLTSA